MTCFVPASFFMQKKETFYHASFLYHRMYRTIIFKNRTYVSFCSHQFSLQFQRHFVDHAIQNPLALYILHVWLPSFSLVLHLPLHSCIMQDKIPSKCKLKFQHPSVI